MARVDRHGLKQQALPAPTAGRAAAKKQRRHRVIIESVGQKQKKLKTTVRRKARTKKPARMLTPEKISFEVRPPNGYTFIPAGNPELTNALKEASREANQHVYAVSASPHAQVHKLSKEVHRIGFHFPTIIVAQVCAQYGITLTSKGEVARDNEDTFRQMRQGRGWSSGLNDDKQKDQITINTEARGAIKDLFPKIPDDDLFTIIKSAFQKGQKKVGTADELSLVRRAQLSVVAHVRHVYTEYDKLLRLVGYLVARSQVEGPTLKKLIEWRGDENNTSGVNVGLEDVMREVIVLSDDEDSNENDDEVVEVSTRANRGSLPSHQFVASDGPISPWQYDQSEDEKVSRHRVVEQAPRRRRLVDANSQAEASTQYRQSRYAAWDRAREELRADPTAIPAALIPLSRHDPKFYYQEPGFTFSGPPAKVRQDLVDTRRPETYIGYIDPQIIHHQNSVEPEFVRGADGYFYQLIHPQAQPGLEVQRRHHTSQAYVSSQPRSPRHAPFHEGQDFNGQAVSGRMLSSVEDSQALSPKYGRSHALQRGYPMDQPTVRTETQVQSNLHSRNVPIIDLTVDTHGHIAERRRVEEPFTSRRPVGEFNDHRRIQDNAVRQQAQGRPARELPYHGQYVTDLPSTRYVRDLLPETQHPVSNNRTSDLRMYEVQGTRSDARVPRPLVDDSHLAPTSRYAYRNESLHDYGQRSGEFITPLPAVRRKGHIAHEIARQYDHQSDAEHRQGDQDNPSEHFTARRDANSRSGLLPAVRVPLYDAGDVSQAKEYVPIVRNHASMPESQPVHRYDLCRNRYEFSDAGRPDPPPFFSADTNAGMSISGPRHMSGTESLHN